MSLTYNANAVITRQVASEIKSLLTARITAENSKEKNKQAIDNSQDQKFDADMIKMGQEIQAKQESDYNKGLDLLVATFCSTTIEDVQKSPFQEFDQVVKNIENDQKELMAFLKVKSLIL